MTQLPILVAAANLTKSPSNVRTVSDAVADAQLEANIAVKGVRQNLIGVPVSRKKGHYRIIAGGRRLDAVHRLIERGVFDADYQLAVLILRDAKDAIETSLEENFFNLTMNPADTCRAFQDIIESEGKTAEDVAKRFGLTERFVHSRLRLADLAEPVFEALRNGEITLSVAIAYASNSDRARQAEVFEFLRDGYYSTNVNEIRRQLAEDTYIASDPKALLVGRDAYIAAGGRVDLDLFTDSTTERWIDGHILNRLAAEKLVTAAEAVREREGFAEVRAVPATFVSYNDFRELRPLKGAGSSRTEEQQKRLDEIQAELATARASYDEAENTDAAELANRIEQLEAEHRLIETPTAVVTDEQKAGAVAYVVIGQDGEPRLHEQLYVAPVANVSPSGTDPENDDETDAGDSAQPGKPAFSQRLSQELAEMKSELLRVHIASDPRFALDLGTFWMVDKATRETGTDDLATELKADAATSALAGFESATLAAQEWSKIDAALDRSWIKVDDTCARYDAFCALTDEDRAAWLGWAIARTLQAVVAGKNGSALIDHLGTKLEIDVAAWWRPTANNFFDRLGSKAAILSHLEEVGGDELASRYGTAQKHELATSAEKIFNGSAPIDAHIREAAIAWLPDVMRYGQAAIGAGHEPVNDLGSSSGDEDLDQAA